jgi:hypothetical protein
VLYPKVKEIVRAGHAARPEPAARTGEAEPDALEALALALGSDANPALSVCAEVAWDAWADAEDEAAAALAEWREEPGRDAYCVYVAARERAEAARSALSHAEDVIRPLW